LNLDRKFCVWQFLAFNNRGLELVNRHHQDLCASNQFLGDLAACFQDEEATKSPKKKKKKKKTKKKRKIKKQKYKKKKKGRQRKKKKKKRRNLLFEPILLKEEFNLLVLSIIICSGALGHHRFAADLCNVVWVGHIHKSVLSQQIYGGERSLSELIRTVFLVIDLTSSRLCLYSRMNSPPALQSSPYVLYCECRKKESRKGQ